MPIPTFKVNTPSAENVLTVESDGTTTISKLVLLDDKTGNKWQLKVSDGQIILEPLELEDKRELKLNEIFK